MDSKMETFDVMDYRDKIAALDQAIFYVYDDWGNKQAISLINHFGFDKEGNLFFCTSRLPVTATNWYTFDAELQFYKKGLPYNLLLSGVATIHDPASRFIYFKPTDAKYHGEAGKPARYNYLQKQWLFLRNLLGQQQAASF